jgi:hypothetical protein
MAEKGGGLLISGNKGFKFFSKLEGKKAQLVFMTTANCSMSLLFYAAVYLIQSVLPLLASSGIPVPYKTVIGIYSAFSL